MTWILPSLLQKTQSGLKIILSGFCEADERVEQHWLPDTNGISSLCWSVQGFGELLVTPTMVSMNLLELVWNMFTETSSILSAGLSSARWRSRMFSIFWKRSAGSCKSAKAVNAPCLMPVV